MHYVLIDAELGDGDLDSIHQSLENILTKLYFKTTLTPEEMKLYDQAGGFRNTFINRAFEIAEVYQDALPANFHYEKALKRKNLHDRLRKLESEVNILSNTVTCTRALVGYSCLNDARVIYKLLKMAEVNTAGLDVLVDELRVFFPNYGKHSGKKTDKKSKKQKLLSKNITWKAAIYEKPAHRLYGRHFLNENR